MCLVFGFHLRRFRLLQCIGEIRCHLGVTVHLLRYLCRKTKFLVHFRFLELFIRKQAVFVEFLDPLHFGLILGTCRILRDGGAYVGGLGQYFLLEGFILLNPCVKFLVGLTGNGAKFFFVALPPLAVAELAEILVAHVLVGML